MAIPPWESLHLVSEPTILGAGVATMFSHSSYYQPSQLSTHIHFHGTNQNHYGYEHYHGSSLPHSYQVPFVYQVDNTNLGFYFVQFGDGSVASMNGDALDNLLKNSYGNFGTNERTSGKEIHSVHFPSEMASLGYVSSELLAPKSENSSLITISLPLRCSKHKRGATRSKRKAWTKKWKYELGRQFTTAKLSSKKIVRRVRTRGSDGELETNLSVGNKIQKEDQSWLVEGNRDIADHMFDKIPDKKKTKVSNNVQVFDKISKQQETALLNDDEVLSHEDDVESNEGISIFSAIDWEKIYELICHDYETRLVRKDNNSQAVANVESSIENLELLTELEQVGADKGASNLLMCPPPLVVCTKINIREDERKPFDEIAISDGVTFFDKAALTFGNLSEVGQQERTIMANEELKSKVKRLEEVEVLKEERCPAPMSLLKPILAKKDYTNWVQSIWEHPLTHYSKALLHKIGDIEIVNYLLQHGGSNDIFPINLPTNNEVQLAIAETKVELLEIYNFLSFQNGNECVELEAIAMLVIHEFRYHLPEEEIALGPACWLWDYLRRSGASGFLLPLSGGADNSSVAAIVDSMCQLVVKEIANGDEQVKADAILINHYSDGQFPTDGKELGKRIFYTVFMGSENSSEATTTRVKVLAEEIGSWHLNVSIDGVVSSLIPLFQTLPGNHPRYKVDGGSNIENLGLQNIQARVRTVLAFVLASLLPWVHNKPGFYLVLGSSNVDEGLRGYLTKVEKASAVLNACFTIKCIYHKLMMTDRGNPNRSWTFSHHEFIRQLSLEVTIEVFVALAIFSLYYDFVKKEFWRYKLKKFHMSMILQVPEVNEVIRCSLNKLWIILVIGRKTDLKEHIFTNPPFLSFNFSTLGTRLMLRRVECKNRCNG